MSRAKRVDDAPTEPAAELPAGVPQASLEEAEFVPPPTVMPALEPAVPVAEPTWAQMIPGEPAYPVKNLDGTWSAGGLCKFVLCVDEAGKPRCIHCQPDMSCSGPPNAEMRSTMVKCIAYIDRAPDRDRL